MFQTRIIEALQAAKRRLRARHDRHYRDNYFHLWADLLLVGIIAGLVIAVIWMLIWQPKPAFGLEAHLVSGRAVSGQLQEFKAVYRNGEDSQVSSAAISVDVPDGFILTDVSPKSAFDPASSTFRLGEIPKGGAGEVSLRGILIGVPGERQVLGLHATYQYGSVQKQLLASLSYAIDSSALETALELPEQAYVKSEFSGTLTLSNSGSAALDNIDVVFPSADWEISFDNEKATDNRLAIPSLAAREKLSVPFSARALRVGALELRAETSLTRGEKQLPQSHSSRTVQIAEPSLLVTANVREKSASATMPNATVDISFTNNEEPPADAISFTITASGPGVELKGVESLTAGVPVRGSTLLYQGELPRGKRSLISVRAAFERHHVETSGTARLNVLVSYHSAGKEYSYSIAAGSVKFDSNLSVSSDAYYYGPQGDQLGVGPVPPRVDIPTTYWVIWQVNNLGNEIKNMEVTADLPAAVAWPDQQSLTSGELSYSPVTRRVLWKPGSVGQGGGNYRVSFGVTLVPRAADLGKVPSLLEKIHFSGTDAFTGSVLSRDLPTITANIEADRLSAGKGTVQPTD